MQDNYEKMIEAKTVLENEVRGLKDNKLNKLWSDFWTRLADIKYLCKGE